MKVKSFTDKFYMNYVYNIFKNIPGNLKMISAYKIFNKSTLPPHSAIFEIDFCNFEHALKYFLNFNCPEKKDFQSSFYEA